MAGRIHIVALFSVMALAGCTSTRGSYQEAFTIVLLPDTQQYSQHFPETYLSQTRWIKASAKKQAVKFVIHLGDIVETPDSEAEWQVAHEAHKILDGHVPYSVLPGNHDGAPGNLTLYNKYFGPARFAGQPWYGGAVSPTNNAVNYCRFMAGERYWMVLSMTCDPTQAELAWARDVAKAHPDDDIILATHAYLLGRGKPGPRGRRIWNEFVRQTPNVRMVVCGHTRGVAHSVAVNDSGGEVYQILCDYVGAPNGGNGWLQTLRVDPASSKIHVQTYSPTLDKHNTEAPHAYTLDVGFLKEE